MESMPQLDDIRQQGILASLAGFSFLLVMGLAWIVGSVLSYWVPIDIRPWIYPCIGGAAMPIAIALERRLGYIPAPNPDPLLPLTLQLLFVQIVAFPAILLVWDSTPHLTPVAFASVVGAHFLPFQWIYCTKVYLALGIAVAVWPFLMALFVGPLVLPLTELDFRTVRLLGYPS